MKKKICVLFALAIALTGCTPTSEGSKQEKQYPEIAPTFSYRFRKNAYRDNYMEVESFIAGNDYLLELNVSNSRTEYSFAYQEDISFSYNENAFEIFPLFEWRKDSKMDAFFYVIHAKALSEETAISFLHLGKKAVEVNKSIKECLTNLTYCRYDSVTNISPIEDDDDYNLKITLVKSMTEMNNYKDLSSNFITIDDTFLTENNLLYITLPWKPSSYRYSNYFIDGDTVYFRIIGPEYYMNSNALIEDFSFTTFIFVIGKADGDTYQNFDVWYNYAR